MQHPPYVPGTPPAFDPAPAAGLVTGTPAQDFGPPPAGAESMPDGRPVAAVGRRAIAWCVDFGLMTAVAGGLGAVTYQRILSPLSGVKASSGVWAAVSSGGDIAGVAADSGSALWWIIVGLVIQAFAALVLVQLVYQAVALSWTGRTLGKVLVDIRVVPAVPVPGPVPGGLPRGRAFRRAVVTTLTDTGLFAVACCLLVIGEFALFVACWLVAVVAFWVNALPAVARRRTLADVVAGTTVVRGGTPTP